MYRLSAILFVHQLFIIIKKLLNILVEHCCASVFNNKNHTMNCLMEACASQSVGHGVDVCGQFIGGNDLRY